MVSLSTSPPAQSTDSSVGDYLALLKPGVMSLVVFTGWVGLWLAPGTLHPFLQVMAIFCIALGSGAAGAINMWYDRDIDAIMKRTQNRPIPAGRIAPEEALAFGSFASVCAVMLIGLALNWLAAALLASAILFYVFIYTMGLKRRTPQNIVIGGAAGAFPPMIGWAAVTGDVSWMSSILFLIIFMWTPPHFWALALFKHDDYRAANVPMLPVTHGIPATKKQIVIYSLLLFPVTLLPLLTGAGMLYGISAALLSGWFIVHAFRTYRDAQGLAARRMFAYSIIYLFVLFSLLAVDKVMLYPLFHDLN